MQEDLGAIAKTSTPLSQNLWSNLSLFLYSWLSVRFRRLSVDSSRFIHNTMKSSPQSRCDSRRLPKRTTDRPTNAEDIDAGRTHIARSREWYEEFLRCQFGNFRSHRQISCFAVYFLQTAWGGQLAQFCETENFVQIGNFFGLRN